jgi:hypothetical protein
MRKKSIFFQFYQKARKRAIYHLKINEKMEKDGKYSKLIKIDQNNQIIYEKQQK